MIRLWLSVAKVAGSHLFCLLPKIHSEVVSRLWVDLQSPAL